MFLTQKPFEFSRIQPSLPHPTLTLGQKSPGEGGVGESGSGFLQEQESMWQLPGWQRLISSSSRRVAVMLPENRVSEALVVDPPGQGRERLFSFQSYTQQAKPNSATEAGKLQ